jgi:hypothetical protein
VKTLAAAVVAFALRPAVVALALPAVALPADAVRIQLTGGAFEARPASAAATLEVYVDSAGDVPPLLGALSRKGDSLVFTPRFPPRPGLRYRAVYRESAAASPVVSVFDVPAAAAKPKTAVVRIDPTADVLPENLLKLYLNFSAPMSRGEAYGRVRLLDAAGRAVELAFLEIDQELWDPEARRLTLLFDPGRVKRELLPNREVGSPLREGATYTLVVDGGWPDADGNALERETRKTFRVGPPDHEPPRTSAWRLSRPRAGSREPLLVTFPESMDRALLERVLEVADDSGARVAGSAAIEGNETRWLFTPREAWRPGEHALRAAAILEDLAGNSLLRPFEVDVFERVEDRALAVTETLRFRVE